MSLSWTAPADVLTEYAEPGWAGIWTLTHAAARAALHLADALPLIDAIELIYAASHLREAQGKLESARPELPARCAAVDLGPLDSDQDFTQAQLVLDQLTTAALNRASDLFDADLTIAEVLTLADVEAALRRAREKILGPRP
jgi:hypothetical protein